MHDYNQLLALFEEHLNSLDYARHPMGLYEPISYILSLGGKRLRPVLAMMVCEMMGKDPKDVLSQAAALEVYHNFTLLHDDLMDKADKRRGKDTVHIRWNDNTAILSGDAMLILSHRLMNATSVELMSEANDLFTMTALEVCEGQQLDMEFESRLDVLEDEYIEMIRLKTSVLLAASLKMGALIAGASKSQQDILYDLGIHMGLAFQLEDDLLDVYGDPEVFGKNIGGDILCNKKTYMLILALERAEGALKEQLKGWLCAESFDPKEKIRAVTEIYDRLGIRSLAQAKIDHYSELALEDLDSLDVPEDHKAVLSALVRKLAVRNR